MYIHAFRYAPPVQVELINYLWPLLTLLCSGIVLHQPLKKGHLLAGALSFSGLLVLLQGDLHNAQILAEHGIGYLFAVGSAVCWTSYTLLTKRFGQVPTEMLGLGCIVSSPMYWIAHKCSETTIPPTLQEWSILAVMGFGVSWTAYYLWDQGIKRGHFRSLNVASYLVPIASVGWLTLFGFTSVTPSLMLACGLVTGGSLLCAWTDHRQLSTA